ncbi:hypothetical protein Desgi_2712 [Desulfoscipio gibsoniae DSM 7213]|uniref:Uncharacterized protein n=1 Tax=Desulfoscipio gibsoniae DSM 7213 TaxID=767817 RepID=R4KR71_9FIRM|nr:hypothetical protein Desgi_2712 [Desulfoscipio gibsoniae DSM 7213]
MVYKKGEKRISTYQPGQKEDQEGTPRGAYTIHNNRQTMTI